MHRAWWLAIGAIVAVPLWYVTLAISAGRSCGAYDSGPDTDAQRSFCGDPADGYAVQFHLVQIIPALIVLAGAAWAFSRSSGRPLLVSSVAAVVCSFLIWALSP